MSNTLYDLDFYAWTAEQAALLRAGRLDQLDIDNIAEEIDSMGRSEKRELVSRLTVLLTHLLKWQYQPGLRCTSWRVTVRGQRDEVTEHLADNPSLRATVEAAVATAYRKARNQAEGESGLSRETFPAACPYPFAAMLRDDFWPE